MRDIILFKQKRILPITAGLLIILMMILAFVGIRSSLNIAKLHTLMYNHPLTVGYAVRDIRIDIAYNSFVNWKPIRDEIFQLSISGAVEEAYARTIGKGAEHVAYMNDMMLNLETYANNKGADFFSNAKSTVNKTIISISIISIFIIIFSILILLVLNNLSNRYFLNIAEAKNVAEAAIKAKGDFLANMSHEIRTPMNAIIGLNHLLARTELSKKQTDYVIKVSNSAKGLLGIINDILDFSKIEAGKMDIENINFEMNDVMDNLLNLISEKVRAKGLELIIAIDKKIPFTINGDPLRISQILINFVSNALKFTENGEIKISCNLDSLEDDTAVLKFSVQDTGLGLSDEQQKKLFSAFTQADTSTTRKYGGTGLGLSISKRLAELMGGSVGVVGELGVGSTFYFTVNCKIIKKHVQNNLIIPQEIHDLRVLIVDDNESARNILNDYISDFNFRVKAVDNGREAISEFLLANGEANDPYHLVLLDYRMPDLNGIEVIKEFRKLKSLDQPKVILVTGYGREEILKEAEDASFDGYLLKPVRQSVLFDTIMQTFGHEDKIESSEKVANTVSTELLNKIRGASVLLVEDNEINQQVAVELLTSEGLFVDVADDGKIGCEMIEQKEYELVFMDLQMPVMDGFEATMRIRKELNRKELPVIAMTADAMTGVEDKVKAVGMNDYITKPIDLGELWKILGKWIKPGDRELPKGFVVENKSEGEISFPKIEGIDTEAGLRRVGNNSRLYKNLLKQLIDDYSDVTKNISVLSEKGQIEEAVREAHTVKGVSANLGAGELQDQMADIEEKLKDGAELKESIAHADEIISRLIRAIVTSGVTTFETSEKSEKISITTEELMGKLQSVNEFLSKRKPKPDIEILQGLHIYDLPVSIMDQINESSKFLDKYKMKDAAI